MTHILHMGRALGRPCIPRRTSVHQGASTCLGHEGAHSQLHRCMSRPLPGGEKYVGEFTDGNKHGQGTVTYSDGTKYVGEFKDGIFHGKGTMSFHDGASYAGEWRNDKVHGQGTYTFASGDQYVGEWKDDKFHGQGTYTWADGRETLGEWKLNKPWNAVQYDASGKLSFSYKDGEPQ